MKRLIIISISFLLFVSCDNSKKGNNSDYRIAVATFSHETCTFCPRPTGIDEFEYYGPPLSGDEVLSVDSYIRGFVSRLAEAIFEIDAPGLGPADLRTIDYENIPKNIYPVYNED